jgi:hypothetical protein
MMGKRRIDKIAGRDPWRVETGYWIKFIKEQFKEDIADPDTAGAMMLSFWMAKGNLRPLAAAIRSYLRTLKRSDSKVHELHPVTLEHLAWMIEKGRLSVKRLGRGNRDPGIFPRDVLMLHLREHTKKSEEEIAKRLDMSPEAVHAQLIKVRKLRRKGAVRW